MRTPINTFLITAVSAFIFSGCSTEDKDSDKVSTESIWSDIYVTTQGESSRVIAELNERSRNGANLNLVNGDRLVASVSNKTKTMEKNNDLFDIDYRATFDLSMQDAQFNVRFSRNNGKENLLSSMVMPGPFKVITPQENREFLPNDVIDVSWIGIPSNTDDTKFEIDFSISCKKQNRDSLSSVVSLSFSDISDNGLFKIDIDDYKKYLEDEEIIKSEPCFIRLYLTRTRYGNVDSRYVNGSRARAIQERYVSDLKLNIS